MRIVPVLIVACVALAGAGNAAIQESPGAAWTAPPETKDRVPDEEIERLVAEPMAQVEKGELDEGIAIFEAMLRVVRASNGTHSIQAADLLIAFGVRLYIEQRRTDDARVGEASLKYMQASVDAYRAAFGPIHPEVALAINSYADVIYGMAPEGEVPTEVIALLKESLKIRLATLGEDNAETRANMTKLANRIAKGARDDPSALVEAESLYRRALRNASRSPEADGITGAVPIRLNLARMLAKSGRSDDALKEIEIVVVDVATWPEDQRCWRLLPALEEIAGSFRDHGTGGLAAKLALTAKALGCADDEQSGIIANA